MHLHTLLRRLEIRLIVLLCIAPNVPLLVLMVNASPSTWSIETVDATGNVDQKKQMACADENKRLN